MSFLEVMGGMLWFKEMCLDVKLTRRGLVVINLDCQLEWIEKHSGGSWGDGPNNVYTCE
jgi:hypothetical protein